MVLLTWAEKGVWAEQRLRELLICQSNSSDFQGGLGDARAGFKGLVSTTTVIILFSKVFAMCVCAGASIH